jgi:2-amino-4-hydroxy-6-hydroxymethyldihydropteridine diphosphokinase
MSIVAYLSLGSNLGDRAQNIDTALRLLTDAALRVRRRSSIYETEPRDYTDQPWFLNMVAEVETELTPRALLTRIRHVEDQLQRQRDIDKGPRTVDIDILTYGDVHIIEPDLVVPHPRMQNRRFVLEPLHDLAPELRLTVSTPAIGDLLSRVSDQIVRKWTG